MPDAITLEGVHKSFGAKVAVRDLDLSVPVGGLYGFIGPNGAGKTTTIRMVMSILFPDRGRVEVLGRASALEAKDRIGYLPEERGVYKKMKVGAFLAYMARLKGLESGVRPLVRSWLERIGLPEVESVRCEELSKGMQQKVQFAAAVIHQPELLILDEPFSGLDPVNMRLLRELVLAEHRRGATVIFSTHVMIQAEEMCDHVVMVNAGDKVLDETVASIRRRFDPHTVELEPLDDGVDPALVSALPAVRSVTTTNGSWELSLVDGADPASVIRDLVAVVPVARVELRRPTLEDVFVQIVAGAASGDAEAALRASVRDAGRGVA